MNPSVILAILRRNLNSYLNTPTGYVFICLFVLLCSAATFCLPEFFTANLANLDQLNKWIAPILLVFIPAITMSIWAEEKRQGTDELLLTIPASDLDVVLGKFLAATGIYTISLFFTMLCNLIMLRILSENNLDHSQFMVTFFGYWLMGEAMLSIGMIASFLTNNLTVSYILGMILNMPLVIMQYTSEGQLSESFARSLREWSLTGQFEDFGRGVFNFSSVVYFFSIIILALYLCLVLIGRRHWSGGRDGQAMGGHYFLRFCGLILAVFGINAMFGGHSVGRVDLSEEKVNSLSKQTYDIVAKIGELSEEEKKGKSAAELKKLKLNKAVRVEAYFSPNLPESYLRQRLTIERFLRELESVSDGMVVAQTNIVEPNTELAYNIEQKYEILPVAVQETQGTARQIREIYMGLAFTSGLNTQVLKFVERDQPIEYELARSIWAVTQKERKKLGILSTQARVSRADNSPFQSLVLELEKIYQVDTVNANAPIALKDSDGKPMYDVLLAVQPSTLGPTALRNFVDAVRQGQNTVIFEDPYPVPFSDSPPILGTYFNPPAPQDPFGQSQNRKGDIKELWDVLGVQLALYPENQVDKILEYMERNRALFPRIFTEPENPAVLSEVRSIVGDLSKILYSTYLPDKKFDDSFSPLEFMFIAMSDPAANNPFNPNSPITAGLDQVLLPFAGAFVETEKSTTKKEYLVRTGKSCGSIPTGAIYLELGLTQRPGSGTQSERLLLSRWETADPATQFVVAYRITGTPSNSKPANLPLADEGSPEKEKQDSAPEPAGPPAFDPQLLQQLKEQQSAKQKRAASKQSASLNVAIISDIDLIRNSFFRMRVNKNPVMNIANHNVTFALNTIDSVAGQNEFLEIRKRDVRLRPLVLIDTLIKQYEDSAKQSEDIHRAETLASKNKIQTDLDNKLKKAEEELQAIDKTKNPSDYEAKEFQNKVLEQTEKLKAQTEQQVLDNRLAKEQAALKRQLNNQVVSYQKFYQWMAVLLPPIVPLVVAFFVFFSRLSRETEGVGRSRLR